jgi:hypothetical protein
MAARLSALRAGRFLLPGRFLVLISVRGWVDPRAIMRLEELYTLKKSTSPGTRTGDLTTCSIVPQPNTLPRAPPLVMKWQINWQEQDLNIRLTSVHRTWITLRHLNWSCQESGQGLEKQKSQKTLGNHNRTQIGKAIYTRALCQKNEGSVKIKQRSIKVDARTIYRILSSKRTSFQTGIDRWSHLCKVPRGRWISHTRPMWLWGYILFKILSPESVLHGTK